MSANSTEATVIFPVMPAVSANASGRSCSAPVRLCRYQRLSSSFPATRRSASERLVAGNDELRRWYRQSLTGAEQERPLAFAETAGMTGKMTVASVLFADIRNFTTYSERLTAGQIAELLNAYFESVCQPIAV